MKERFNIKIKPKQLSGIKNAIKKGSLEKLKESHGRALYKIKLDSMLMVVVYDVELGEIVTVLEPSEYLGRREYAKRMQSLKKSIDFL